MGEAEGVMSKGSLLTPAPPGKGFSLQTVKSASWLPLQLPIIQPPRFFPRASLLLFRQLPSTQHPCRSPGLYSSPGPPASEQKGEGEDPFHRSQDPRGTELAPRFTLAQNILSTALFKLGY